MYNDTDKIFVKWEGMPYADAEHKLFKIKFQECESRTFKFKTRATKRMQRKKKSVTDKQWYAK